MAEGIPGLIRWAPDTDYFAGERLAAPNGDIVTAKTNFRSGTVYNPANWNQSTQATRIDNNETAVGKVRKSVAAVNEIGAGFVDPNGLVSEMVVGTDGKVPAWVLASWHKRMGTKLAPFALTCADNSSSIDSRSAVGARIPFRFPVDVLDFRAHIRNNNDQYVFTYNGALNFDGLAYGAHDMGTTGTHTGKFLGTPTALASGFATPSGGTEWVSPWAGAEVPANKEMLLSYGYTCTAGQQNASTLAGSYQSANNTSWNAIQDAGAVAADHTPLDIWLELKVAGGVRLVAYLGDSLTVGVSARFPVYDSYPMQHARANGHLPLMYAHSGSTMERWIAGAGTPRYTKWAGLAKPDALVWSLPRNDIFASGADVATLRTRFAALYPLITSVTTTNLFLTTVLPSFDAGAPAEAVRQSWNNILIDELPGNAVMTFDAAKSLESSTVGVLDSRWSAAPGDIHLNRQGYARFAQQINQPLHR